MNNLSLFLRNLLNGNLCNLSVFGMEKRVDPRGGKGKGVRREAMLDVELKGLFRNWEKKGRRERGKRRGGGGHTSHAFVPSYGRVRILHMLGKKELSEE